MDKRVGVDPRTVIVPLFSGRQRAENYLGTGSIIGDGTVLLTADHVIRDHLNQVASAGALSTGALGFMVRVDGKLRSFGLDVAERDERKDLALLRINGYTAPKPLRVAFDVPVHYNSNLLTFEYAQTRKTEDGKILLNPAARRGHKTRTVNAEKLGPAGVDAIELSFPALQGASGAPVVFDPASNADHEPQMGIVGVLVSNVDYHTIPAEIVTLVGDDDRYIEERKFMLPQGLAVNVEHLKPMYERVIGPIPPADDASD